MSVGGCFSGSPFPRHVGLSLLADEGSAVRRVSGNRLAPFGHGIVVAAAVGGKVDIGGRPAVVVARYHVLRGAGPGCSMSGASKGNQHYQGTGFHLDISG